jgi:hypothetical protein
MLFDGPPAELPSATLRPSVPRARRRRILVDLDLWMSARWTWVRPRAVPLLVAFAGLFATLGVVKAVGVRAHGEPLQLPVHASIVHFAPPPPRPETGPYTMVLQQPAERPVRILLRPLLPNGNYIELTVGSIDPR